MLEQLADLDAALAIFLELERGLKSRAGAALGWQIFHRQRFAVEPRQSRLGIERIDMRRPAIGEDMNNACGARWKMRGAWGQRCVTTHAVAGDGGPENRCAEQVCQAQHPEANS